MADLSEETILQTIAPVVHPTINATLCDLGMIGRIRYNPDRNRINLTLSVPILDIPVEFKNCLFGTLHAAMRPLGAEVKISLAKMTDKTWQKYLTVACECSERSKETPPPSSS